MAGEPAFRQIRGPSTGHHRSDARGAATSGHQGGGAGAGTEVADRHRTTWALQRRAANEPTGDRRRFNHETASICSFGTLNGSSTQAAPAVISSPPTETTFSKGETTTRASAPSAGLVKLRPWASHARSARGVHSCRVDVDGWPPLRPIHLFAGVLHHVLPPLVHHRGSWIARPQLGMTRG